jgi:hypothetical protein
MDIPEELITVVDPSALPGDWRAIPVPNRMKEIGNVWFNSQKTPVLRVFSTVIPVQYN